MILEEIKLRAKPKDLAHEQFPEKYLKRNFDFVYGTGLYNDGYNIWLILENNNKKCFADLASKIVEPETVGRYIGKINNINLYEDDIVEVYFSDMDKWEIGIMQWHEERMGYYWYDGYNDPWKLSLYNKIKLIGNKHDNPELLGV